MKIRTVVYSNYNFPIPSGLIFQKLLNIDEELTGQSVTVHSVFNPDDKTPSMIIYYSENNKDNYYRFKDFSSGEFGDAIDLFMHMNQNKYELRDRQDAYRKILELFKNDESFDPSSYSNKTIIKQESEISNYVTRQWKKHDEKYWKDHGVTGKFAKEYLIKPLQSYTMKVAKLGEIKEFLFERPYCYGYFNKAGELCKIYNPGQKKGKFIRVKSLIQGYEQLKPNKRCALIMASMKDMGAFAGLNYNSFNIISPESENVELPAEIIEELKRDHEFVFTLLDNDIEGMKRMLYYKQHYGIPYIPFPHEKDFAQTRFDHGPESTKEFFTIAFNKALKKFKHERSTRTSE
jgi:hypothetical protein